MNGRYGAYLSYKGTNYRLTKALQERAQELTYDECMTIVKEQDEKPKSPAKRRFAKRKA
jgi:DNA topoisomerase-1